MSDSAKTLTWNSMKDPARSRMLALLVVLAACVAFSAAMCAPQLAFADDGEIDGTTVSAVEDSADEEPAPASEPAPVPDPAPAPASDPTPEPAAAAVPDPAPVAAEPEPAPVADTAPAPAADSAPAEAQSAEPAAEPAAEEPATDAGSAPEATSGESEPTVATNGAQESDAVTTAAASGTRAASDGAKAGGDGDATPAEPATNEATTQVPTGSCYIAEVGDSVLYNNSNTDNAIQLAINAALAKASKNNPQNAKIYTADTITIVVKDGTYEGSVRIEPQYTIKNTDGSISTHTFEPYDEIETFTIIIRSASVLSEEGNALAEGGVGANVLASFVINKLCVEMSGLFFSGGAKNDIDAVYSGAANTSTKIDVSDAPSFKFDGTSGNDSVVIALNDVTWTHINMGAGDDTVSIAYKLTESSGIRQVSDVRGGAGDDTINLSFDTSENLQAFFSIQGEAGNDTISVRGPKEVTSMSANIIEIDGGFGDDLITLDTSLQAVANNTADKFKVMGGAGADRVHLTAPSIAIRTATSMASTAIGRNWYSSRTRPSSMSPPRRSPTTRWS